MNILVSMYFIDVFCDVISILVVFGFCLDFFVIFGCIVLFIVEIGVGFGDVLVVLVVVYFE